MSGTVTTIDTPLTGANGSNAMAFPPDGASGGPGGSEAETAAPFSNEDFTPLFPANGGALTPQVTGGFGGTGGTGGFSGNNGAAGGTGGAGGTATLVLDDDSIGTPASTFGLGSFGGLSLTGSTHGGDAGFGGNGSNGANIGTTSGGDGGVGGNGGNADTELDGFSAYVVNGPTLQLSAAAGAGGYGGTAGHGVNGNSVAGWGVGGDGGDGGNATTALTDSTIADDTGVVLRLSAQAGDAGWGEGGGPGGQGGNGGSAAADLAGNHITGPDLNVTIDTFAGAAGYGGQSLDGGNPGGDGVAGGGTITFTNNVFTVGKAIPGEQDFSSDSGDLVINLEAQTGVADQVTQTVSYAADALNGGASGNLVFFGNQFIGNGASTLDLFDHGGGPETIDTAAGTLEIGGSPGNSMTGFTSFGLDNNATFIAGSGNYTVSFHPDPDTLVYSKTSGNVVLQDLTGSNFRLDFQGFGPSFTAATVQQDTDTFSNNTFIFLSNGNSIELQGYDGGISTSDILIGPLCFCAGTRIATPNGEAAVEALQVGDLVRLADGRALPVRWLGRQTVASRFTDPVRAWPVRVRAGALGGNLPMRDLVVSPGHALLLDGLLVQAGALVNGTTIVREAKVPETFTYWHVELGEHAILLAEGAAAESFLETVQEMPFDNEAARPAAAVPVAELPYPRVKAQRQLPAALRRRLTAQPIPAPLAEAA
jgi:hypothetical protein